MDRLVKFRLAGITAQYLIKNRLQLFINLAQKYLPDAYFDHLCIGDAPFRNPIRAIGAVIQFGINPYARRFRAVPMI
ncbi:hypothetical protein [uncultured Sphingomonas sp.]|uniref:hypothetical protein n=1 Tax=uncultured Sphingomonas sp. TaxID=158754 RepID=UPI00260C634E|nr:hypothetical protein [uncultured Sphingomonas sp.]